MTNDNVNGEVPPRNESAQVKPRSARRLRKGSRASESQIPHDREVRRAQNELLEMLAAGVARRLASENEERR